MSSPRLYCDTSVFVALILGSGAPGFQESLDTLRAAERGSFEGFLSGLVVAEVVGAPAIRSPQGVPKAVAHRRMRAALRFFERSAFHYLEVDKRAGLRAGEIARDFDMKGADALHLAVAEVNGCEVFCSWDHDQLKVEDRILGLSIRRPQLGAQAELEFL